MFDKVFGGGGGSGGVLGGFTDWVGITNYSEQDRQSARGRHLSKQAVEASKKGVEVSEELLAFQKQRLARWESVFGSTEQNLANFYNSLTPESISKFGLAQQKQQYQTASRQVQERLAQRGLGNSKFAQYVAASMDFQNATRKAEIQAEAPFKVAQAQMGFYNLGLQQEQNIQAGIASGYGAVANAHTNVANIYSGQAGQAFNLAGQYSQGNAAVISGIAHAAGYAAAGGFGGVDGGGDQAANTSMGVHTPPQSRTFFPPLF